MLTVCEKFLRVTPTYTERQIEDLRQHLREKGCTWPLMKWRDFLADDVHVYETCSAEDIHYSTEELTCRNVAEAIPLVIYTMLSRGTLTPFQRCELLIRNREYLGSTDLSRLAGVSEEDFDAAEQLLFLEDEEALIRAIENRVPIRKAFQDLMDRCDLEELRNDLRVFLNNFNERDKKSYVLAELRACSVSLK